MNMSFFNDLNEKINLTIQMILANQDLCKLLYYNDYSPLSQPTISDTSILLTNHIIPMPKGTSLVTDKTSILNIYFFDATPYPNSGYRELHLCIDIMCHLDVWMCDGGIRPYLISSKLDNMFNNMLIPTLSNNKIFFEDWKYGRYSDLFYGYRAIYRFGTDSNVGSVCR